MKNNIFFLRIGGILIDLMCIFFLSAAINVVLLIFGLEFINDTEIYSQGQFLFSFFFIFYFFIFVFLNSHTVGKKTLKLKVIATRGILTKKRLLFRSFLAIIFYLLIPQYIMITDWFTGPAKSLIVLFVFMLPFFYKLKGRLIHDLMANTVVIKQ